MPFENRCMRIKGTIVSGTGEGRHYLVKEEYKTQCEKNLGFAPFPGTLNIRIDREDIKKFRTLKKQEGILLHGFKKNSKVFGNVKCFKAVLNERKIMVVIPEKSSYTDVMEIISDKNLRKELNLKDGDAVEVEVPADAWD